MEAAQRDANKIQMTSQSRLIISMFTHTEMQSSSSKGVSWEPRNLKLFNFYCKRIEIHK